MVSRFWCMAMLLLASLVLVPVRATAAPADPVWGDYAKVIGRTARGSGGGFSLRWYWSEPGKTLVQEYLNPGDGSSSHLETITRGEVPGTFVLQSSALAKKQWLGRLQDDGSVLFIGTGFLKYHYVAGLGADGNWEMRGVKLDGERIASVVGPEKYSRFLMEGGAGGASAGAPAAVTPAVVAEQRTAPAATAQDVIAVGAPVRITLPTEATSDEGSFGTRCLRVDLEAGQGYRFTATTPAGADSFVALSQYRQPDCKTGILNDDYTRSGRLAFKFRSSGGGSYFMLVRAHAGPIDVALEKIDGQLAVQRIGTGLPLGTPAPTVRTVAATPTPASAPTPTPAPAVAAVGASPVAAVAPAAAVQAAGSSAAPVVAGPGPAPAGRPKQGPRQLSEADLALLRARMDKDKVRRTQNLRRQQQAAEEQRRQIAWQAEQNRLAAEQEEAEDDARQAARTNNWANVLGAFERGFNQATADNERMRNTLQSGIDRGIAEGAALYAQKQAQQARLDAQARAADAAHARDVREREELARQARAAEQRAAEAQRGAVAERTAAQRLAGQASDRRPVERQASMPVGGGSAGPASTLTDPGTCVTRPRTSPNRACGKGYAATITNQCAQPVDARICHMTARGWDCGASWGIKPGSDWSYAVCASTGETFMSVRSTGVNAPLASPPSR